MKTASRIDRIEPFYVMEMAKAAQALAQGPLCDPAQGGRPMIYLNVGEPDFTATPEVQAAAVACIEAGLTQYTDATGLPALREAIARWYGEHFKVAVSPERIVITAGASAALQLATLALVDIGDEVLMSDPSYPCNRHFVTAASGRAVLLPTTAAQRFQLEAEQVREAWGARTRGVLLASPSNPTGTSIAPDALRDIVEVARSRGGFVIADEIYLGLSYDAAFGRSALALGDDIIAINSFSKYFGMTGWRLGWLVLPPALVPAVEKLAQNLYICPSTVAQRAALACFQPSALAQYEMRRTSFAQRRDLAVAALNAMGLTVPVTPDGAFYAYADVSAHAASSWDFCLDMMHRAQVALTPGRDFGPAHGERTLRLSFASETAQLQTALQRLAAVLRL
jgi:aspartate/methionine/tyrosine aminotransferase